jgi:NADH-quinone oxidoreductase subunit L
MRKMGGLRKYMPWTFATMTIATLAISGIPPFAGFFSKDEILYRTFTAPGVLPKFLWLVGLITAGMTSFYMFRLWFKTFFGEPHFDEKAELHERGAAVHLHSGTHAVMVADHDDNVRSHAIHESPWIMLLPLVLLAILSFVGGWVGVPSALGGHNEIEGFLAPVFANPAAPEAASTAASHGLELALAAVSVLVAALGFYVAYLWYYKKPGTAAALAERAQPAYTVLSHKYWVDEIYANFLVTPLLMFTRGFLELIFERGVVNGSGKASGTAVRGLAWLERTQISGNIRSYAGWLALGAAAVIAIMIFGRAVWMHP